MDTSSVASGATASLLTPAVASPGEISAEGSDSPQAFVDALSSAADTAVGDGSQEGVEGPRSHHNDVPLGLSLPWVPPALLGSPSFPPAPPAVSGEPTISRVFGSPAGVFHPLISLPGASVGPTQTGTVPPTTPIPPPTSPTGGVVPETPPVPSQPAGPVSPGFAAGLLASESGTVDPGVIPPESEVASIARQEVEAIPSLANPTLGGTATTRAVDPVAGAAPSAPTSAADTLATPRANGLATIATGTVGPEVEPVPAPANVTPVAAAITPVVDPVERPTPGVSAAAASGRSEAADLLVNAAPIVSQSGAAQVNPTGGLPANDDPALPERPGADSLTAREPASPQSKVVAPLVSPVIDAAVQTSPPGFSSSAVTSQIAVAPNADGGLGLTPSTPDFAPAVKAALANPGSDVIDPIPVRPRGTQAEGGNGAGRQIDFRLTGEPGEAFRRVNPGGGADAKADSGFAFLPGAMGALAPAQTTGSGLVVPPFAALLHNAAGGAALLDHVVEHAALLRFPDRTEMTLELRPANLGEIHLHLSQDSGSVKVHITATDPQVHQLLAANLADLTGRLQEQGRPVEVDLRWDQGAAQDAPHQSSQQERAFGGDEAEPEPATPAAGENPRPRRMPGASIDYRA